MLPDEKEVKVLYVRAAEIWFALRTSGILDGFARDLPPCASPLEHELLNASISARSGKGAKYVHALSALVSQLGGLTMQLANDIYQCLILANYVPSACTNEAQSQP